MPMFTHTILHSILFDFLVGMIIYVYGLFFSLLTLIIAVVSETVVLHRLHYGPFMRSFGASVLMNTI